MRRPSRRERSGSPRADPRGLATGRGANERISGQKEEQKRRLSSPLMSPSLFPGQLAMKVSSLDYRLCALTFIKIKKKTAERALAEIRKKEKGPSVPLSPLFNFMFPWRSKHFPHRQTEKAKCFCFFFDRETLFCVRNLPRIKSARKLLYVTNPQEEPQPASHLSSDATYLARQLPTLHQLEMNLIYGS